MLLVFGTAGATGRSRQPPVRAAPPTETARPARPARSNVQALRLDWLDLLFSIIGRTPCVDRKPSGASWEGDPRDRAGRGRRRARQGTGVWRSGRLKGREPTCQRCETAGTK